MYDCEWPKPLSSVKFAGYFIEIHVIKDRLEVGLVHVLFKHAVEEMVVFFPQRLVGRHRRLYYGRIDDPRNVV